MLGIAAAITGPLSLALGWLGVDQVQSNGGVDAQGIALLITAISGLIGTVGALVIALRRRPSTTDDLALKVLAKQMGIDPDTLDER